MVKLSIIVPVYNVEQYLAKCLNSLVNQTLKNFEILIVNDGTKDDSQRIIDEYQKQYPYLISQFKKENGGLSSARNYGLKFAQGEFIAFVDSDDYVEPTMYEKMYNKAKEHDFDMVMCDFKEIHESKTIEYSCHLEEDIFTKQAIQEHMVEFYPSAWNKIYKRKLIQHFLFKEGVWFEDVEWGYRLLPYVNCIGVVHEHFYNYFIRKGSITSSTDSRIYDYIKNWNGILDYYRKEKIYHKYKNELEYSYVRYLYATFIKTAAKYDKQEYKRAVRCAIANVNEKFPNYRQNCYLKNSPKDIYLKKFSLPLAMVVYYSSKWR